MPCFENIFKHLFSSFEFFPTHVIRQSHQAANKNVVVYLLRWICSTVWPAEHDGVDAKSDGVADPKDLSGEELRAVKESEVRFRDAITSHYRRPALQKYAPKLSNKTLMISISNFYQYYHLANHSNDISHVSQCLVILKFVLLRIVVNIPRVAVGRSASRGPLSTKKCNVCQTLCFTLWLMLMLSFSVSSYMEYKLLHLQIE